jgi:hypothetical protein
MATDRPPERHDLVKYLPTGEVFDVDSYNPGSQYVAATVSLVRTSAHDHKNIHVTRFDARPCAVRLIERACERTVFPGDGWSDLALDETA